MSTMALRHGTTTAITVVVPFWAATAAAVTGAHQILEPVSPAGCLAVKIAVILVMAFAYARLAARGVTIDQALFAGVAWAALSIVAELIAETHFDRSWHALLGSPERAAFRNVLLFVWIAAPALFARTRS